MDPVYTAIRNGAPVKELTPLLSGRSNDEMNALVKRKHILQTAIEYGASPEVILALIKAGAEVNARGLYGFAALTWAAMLDEKDDKDYKIALMKELLAAGADVKNEGFHKETALYMAALHGQMEAVALLEAELKKKGNQEGGRRRTRSRAKRGKAHRSRKTRQRRNRGT